MEIKPVSRHFSKSTLLTYNSLISEFAQSQFSNLTFIKDNLDNFKLLDEVEIAQGALTKFFNENTLLNQSFVKDSKLTVRQYLASNDKDLTVTAFLRYGLGD